MDSVIAARMREGIVGSEVGGWRAAEFLGTGKSALVLKAEKGAQIAALKIFDPDLVIKYGETTQLARIDREKRLIGKSRVPTACGSILNPARKNMVRQGADTKPVAPDPR
jgi:eukaryotic-like serine/threonine-protein kinase